LHFGEHFNPKSLGPVIYAVLNAPTTAAACQIAGRYLHVHNGAAKLSVSIENGRGYVRYLSNGLDEQTSRQYNEHAMTVLLNTIRLMIGSQWTPQEVHFPHQAPDQTTEHIRVFRAPVLFGCETNAFIIGHEILERQVPGADPRLYQILQRYLEQALADIPLEDKVLASVRKAIAETMGEGDPSLTRVGKHLALSPRTLQRRLEERGTKFNNLMDDTRRRFAIGYLKGDDHTLTQIAFLLGYSEVSAFNRAFKRWTGSTPSNYRRKGAK
jgi:AraC-like DNA-binding protein